MENTVAYDVAEQVWKIPVFATSGQIAGLFEPESHVRAEWGGVPIDPEQQPIWTGRPRAQHCEVLYRLWSPSGVRYLLLYNFGLTSTERDYGRFLQPEHASAWLTDEHYPLPSDLQELAVDDARKVAGQEPRAFPRLTDAQRAVWDQLDGAALSAKELAIRIRGGHRAADAMRKRVQSIRKTGRVVQEVRGLGYLRPDAPPPGY